MNRKARLNYIHALSSQVERKKMYKAKKQWVVAGISFLVATGMGAIGSHLTTHAAQVNNPTTNRVASGANSNQKAPASVSSQQQNSASTKNIQPLSASNIQSQASGFHRQLLQTQINKPIQPQHHAMVKVSNELGSIRHNLGAESAPTQKATDTNWIYDKQHNNYISDGQVNDWQNQSVYDGLSWKYNPEVNAAEFTSGKIQTGSGFIANSPSNIRNAKSIKFDKGTVAPNNLDDFLKGDSSLVSLNMNGLDTSHTTSMIHMLGWTTSLASFKGSDLNVSNVKNMIGTFQVTNISDLELSDWKTSNVSDFSSFISDNNLKTLNLGGSFDTRKAINNTNAKYSQYGRNGEAYLINPIPEKIVLNPKAILGNTNASIVFTSDGNNSLPVTYGNGTNSVIINDGKPHSGSWTTNENTIKNTYTSEISSLISSVATINTNESSTDTDIYSLASELINSDDSKVADLFSKNKEYSGNTSLTSMSSQANIISNAQVTINSASSTLNNDKSNASSVMNDVTNAARAYENAYSANAVIESLENTNLSSANSQANSNSGWINSNSSSLSQASNEANTANTWVSNNSNSAQSADSWIAKNSSSITSVDTSATSVADWLNNNASVFSSVSSSASSAYSYYSASSSTIKSLVGDTTSLESAWTSASNAWSYVSSESSSITKAINNANDAVNDYNNDTKDSLSTAYASANAAYTSLTSQKGSIQNALSTLKTINNSFSTAYNSATSAESYLEKNSGSFAALDTKITQDSNALSGAIKAKADSATVNHDYQELSGDISTANTDIKNNASAISDLKNNTAITFTFTKDNKQFHSPITLTSSYIENNATPVGNTKQGAFGTYNVTNVLNVSAPTGYSVANQYTVTIDKNSNGIAQIKFNGSTGSVSMGNPFSSRHLLSAMQTESSSNTANDVALIGNEAEYSGDIILDFGKNSQGQEEKATIHYDTGKNNANIRTGDTINLLQYADTKATAPSDYTKDNLTGYGLNDGFDITGFKFTNANSNQYDIKVQPSDTKTGTNSTSQNNTKSVTLHYSTMPVNDKITYKYGDHTEGTDTATGNNDSSATWTANNVKGLNSDWQLEKATNTFNITTKGTSINVVPKQSDYTVNYVDDNQNSANHGKSMGTQVFKGNIDAGTVPKDAGLTQVTINSTNATLPTGYELQTANNLITLQNGNLTIYVKGVAHQQPNKNSSKNPFNSKNTNNPANSDSSNNPTNSKNTNGTTNPSNPNSPLNTGNKHHQDTTGTNGKTNPWNPSSKNSPYNPSNSDSPFNPNSPLNPNKIGGNDDPNNPNSPVDPQNPNSPLNQKNSKSPLNPNNNSYEPNNSKNDPWNPNNSDSPLNPTSPISPYNPSNSNSPLDPNGTQANYNAKNGVATIIVAEFINNKQIGGYATTQDVSNMTTGEQATINAPTINGYSVNGSDSFTTTMNNNGSLINGTHQFNYDVNAKDIAPITITYKNQNGDYINTQTGSDLGNSNVSDKATVTISASDLAKLGANGDYVDITGIDPVTSKPFFTAPTGYSFTNKDLSISGVALNNIQLTSPKVSMGNPLGAIRLEALVPTNSKPNSNANSSSSSATQVSMSSDQLASLAKDIGSHITIKPNISENDEVVDNSALTSLASEVATENQSINNLANKPENTNNINYNNFDNLINQGINRLSNTINKDLKTDIHNTAKINTNNFKKVKKHIRWIMITKPVKLYSRNGEARTLRPSKVTLDVQSVYRAHGHFVFKVSYHHHTYFMADNHKSFKNAYLAQGKFAGRRVRVLNTVYEFKSKDHDIVKKLHKGSTLRIRRVVKIGNFNMTRIQLANNNWISANKNYIKVL